MGNGISLFHSLSPAGFSPALLVVALGIVALAHGCGWLARCLGQPALLGQVGAGLLLGPVLPGPAWSAPGQWLWTEPLGTVLMAIAQVGIGIHLLRAGLQFSQRLLRTAAPRFHHLLRAAAFAFGAALGVWLHPQSGDSAELIPFALLIGCSFALWPMFTVTPGSNSNPSTPPSSEPIDLIYWLLPLVAALLLSGLERFSALTLVYVAVVAMALLIAHRWLVRQAKRDLSPRLAIKLALLVLMAAAVVEPLGLPAVLGVLAIGTLLGSAAQPAQALDRQLLPLQTLLLPAFFLGVGLRIDPSSPTLTAGFAVGIAVVTLFMLAVLANVFVRRRADRSDMPTTVWTMPAALALIALQLGLDRGLLPTPLYSALTLGLLVALAAAAAAVNRLAPHPVGARRCVPLYRIAP